jgi:hypothetical protein
MGILGSVIERVIQNLGGELSTFRIGIWWNMWNYGHFWMEMVEYFIEPAELAFAGHAGTDTSIGTEVKGGKGSAATAEQSTEYGWGWK